jgi:hypothetical protein
MRTFKDIIEDMKNPKGQKYSVYELIKIFKNECSWAGNNQQQLELFSYSHEITGIRVNTNCSGCVLTALKNLSNWLEREEKIINYEKNNNSNANNSKLHKGRTTKQF